MYFNFLKFKCRPNLQEILSLKSNIIRNNLKRQNKQMPNRDRCSIFTTRISLRNISMSQGRWLRNRLVAHFNRNNFSSSNLIAGLCERSSWPRVWPRKDRGIWNCLVCCKRWKSRRTIIVISTKSTNTLQSNNNKRCANPQIKNRKCSKKVM